MYGVEGSSIDRITPSPFTVILEWRLFPRLALEAVTVYIVRIYVSVLSSSPYTFSTIFNNDLTDLLFMREVKNW